ncbi:MAG: response regulator [Candidatus Paceibacteria bacterium]
MAKKVLYVEDEEFFAKIISKQLSGMGYEVTTEPDGEAGLKAVERETFDLIFLDLILPNLGGFDILKKLKENDKTKGIPVVILSNLSSEEDKRKANELGAEKFCVKMSTYPQQVAEIAKKILDAPKTAEA